MANQFVEQGSCDMGLSFVTEDLWAQIEEVESDFDWWIQHYEDRDLAAELAHKADVLLKRAAFSIFPNPKEQGRVCRSLLNITNRLDEFLSGLSVSSLSVALMESA